MTLEEFKKKVEEILKEITTQENMLRIMETYKNDFQKLLEDGWKPEIAAQAMVNYYI